jgi:acyl-coenzyme A synthetase/AMP-(fatty) acid ligase
MSTQEKIKRKAGRPAGSKNHKTQSVAEISNDVQVVAESRLEKEINRSVHKTRVPIGRFRDILAVKDLPPGKVGRWVLDNDK